MLDTIHLRKNLLSWRSIPMGPQGFPKLQYIKNIYLTDNKIEQCPWEFGYLTNLESLAINTNKYLTELPDELGGMVNLKSFLYHLPILIAFALEKLLNHYNLTQLLFVLTYLA